MHELGICDALLKMVDNVAKDEELECVKKVTVEVGTLSGVIPAYLADCWTAVTDGTARCLDCGAEFTAELEQLRCPNCGGEKLTPLTGRDLTLKEIEAY